MGQSHSQHLMLIGSLVISARNTLSLLGLTWEELVLLTVHKALNIKESTIYWIEMLADHVTEVVQQSGGPVLSSASINGTNFIIMCVLRFVF